MKRFLCLILIGVVLFSACGNKTPEIEGNITEEYSSTTNELTETTTISKRSTPFK